MSIEPKEEQNKSLTEQRDAFNQVKEDFRALNTDIAPESYDKPPAGIESYVISKQIKKMDEARLLSNEDLEEKGIIYAGFSNREVVNRFRELRTKLLEKSAGNNFSLVVSSCAVGGGASFVAMNIAASFAFDSTKTALIIDCNLREPTLHEKLDLNPDHGLTDFLEDPNLDIASIIYPTGIQRLRLIPTGSKREYPGEFFTSFRMKQFIHAVRKRYPDRFVIIDAPSLEETPDARILSEICDYTLLVVPHSKNTEDQVLAAVSAIGQEKLAGVVIND